MAFRPVRESSSFSVGEKRGDTLAARAEVTSVLQKD
jgi:hypothetical protein